MNYIFVHLLDNKMFWSSLMHGTSMKATMCLLLRTAAFLKIIYGEFLVYYIFSLC